MYAAYQAHADLLWPLRTATRLSLPLLQDAHLADNGWLPARQWAAAGKVFELAQVTHARPPWRITEVVAGDERWPVTEEATQVTPFATLRRFARTGAPVQPKVLVVAPMSGHFATLLRDTVRALLQDHDVYVTDWHNVRDVPLAAGHFGLDEYTQHLIDFLATLAPAPMSSRCASPASARWRRWR